MNEQELRNVSLQILEKAMNLASLETEPSKDNRLDEFICDFVPVRISESLSIEIAAGWHFCVPSSFKAALDIQLTPRKINKRTEYSWTQGSWFDFKLGDTIYDSPNAYLPWSLSNFKICLDVTKSVPAQPRNKSDRQNRNHGSVIFNILVPENGNLVIKGTKALTQDEFIRLLINGPEMAKLNFYHSPKV